MLQIITINKLAEKLKYSPSTIRTYIGRYEFSHLQFLKINKMDVIKGITNKDIKRLRELIRKRCKRNRKR